MLAASSLTRLSALNDELADVERRLHEAFVVFERQKAVSHIARTTRVLGALADARRALNEATETR